MGMRMIANFFVSELLWALTGGRWQIIVSAVLMTLCLRWYMKYPWLRSLSISVMLRVAAFGFFAMVVAFLVMTGLAESSYNPETETFGVLMASGASFALAVIYAVVEAAIVLVYSVRYNVDSISMLSLIVISEFVAALWIGGL